MQIESPSRQLTPFVKSYWGLEHQVPRGGDYVHRIVPNGLSELIFYLGDLPESLDREKSITENTLLSGQQKEYYDLRISGKLSLFSIIFQPHGLMVFFDIPVHELFNQNVPLKYILKEVVGELEDSLHEAADFSERIRLVEEFLQKRLIKSSKKYEFERIRCTIELINQQRGQVDIDTLAHHSCLSRKQFERIFQEHVGSSPGQFLKTVRFQQAVHEKSMDGKLSLTELSYLSGYYDQSHMNADFRKLAGMTPGQYFKYCEPYSDYFQSDTRKR
jgi:AraC-like DNA-binding protein